MANLADFLVSIRFTQSGAAEAEKSIASITKGLAGVALGLVAIAVAAKKSTENQAKQLHGLYVDSKRAGVGTISTFKAIQAAAESVGISGDSMVSSLMGLKQFSNFGGSSALSFMQGINKEIKATDSSDVKLAKLGKGLYKIKQIKGDTLDTKAEIMSIGTQLGISADALEEFYNKGEVGSEKTLQAHKSASQAGDEALATSEKLHNTMILYQETFDAQLNQKSIPLMKKNTEFLTASIEKMPAIAEVAAKGMELLDSAVSALTTKLEPLYNMVLKFASVNPETTIAAIGVVTAFMLGLPGLLIRGMGAIATGVGTLVTGIGTLATSAGTAVAGMLGTALLPITALLAGLGLMGSAYSDVKDKRLAEQKAKGTEDPKTWTELWSRLKENNDWLKDASDETNSSLKESKKRADEIRKDAKDSFDETKKGIKDATEDSKKWISDLFDTFKTKAGDTLGAVGDMLLSPASADETPYKDANGNIGDASVGGQTPTGLGSLSSKFEGNVASANKDNIGYAYGKYQFNSETGGLANFFKDNPEYATQFKGIAKDSSAFASKWKEIAKTDKVNFEAAQDKSAAKIWYKPAEAKATELGFNTKNRGVQEAIFSGSIQHGGIKKILAGVAKNNNLKDMSAEEQVAAFYKERRAYVGKNLKGNVLAGVLKRYDSEEKDALKLSKGSKPETKIDVTIANLLKPVVKPELSKGVQVALAPKEVKEATPVDAKSPSNFASNRSAEQQYRQGNQVTTVAGNTSITVNGVQTNEQTAEVVRATLQKQQQKLATQQVGGIR